MYRGALLQQTRGRSLLRSPGLPCPLDSTGLDECQGNDKEPKPEGNSVVLLGVLYEEVPLPNFISAFLNLDVLD